MSAAVSLRFRRVLLWLLMLALLAVACSGVGGAGSEGTGSGLPEGARWLDGHRIGRDVGVGRTVPPGGVFVDIAASSLRTCGVRVGGELVCWGEPWRASGGPEVLPSGRFVRVSLGADHGCAIAVDGSLACWLDDRLGDRELLWRSSWVQVPEGSFVDVSAEALCAVRVGGELACWGDSGAGWSGPPEGRFVEIAGTDPASGRVCALRADGEMVCWGDPLALVRDRGPEGRYADLDMAGGSACAVRADGAVVCWAPGAEGSGVGAFGEVVEVREGDYVSVSLRGEGPCALSAGRGVDCWGDSGFAQRASRRGLFASFDVRGSSLCALDVQGRVSCWGEREDEPGVWADWDAWGFPDDERFTQVSVTLAAACGVRVDSKLDCWERPGWEFGNQGGRDISGRHPWFGFVSGPGNLALNRGGFVSVSAGDEWLCALRENGTPWCNRLNRGNAHRGIERAVDREVDEGGFVEFWVDETRPSEPAVCAVRANGTPWCSLGYPGLHRVEGQFREFFPRDEHRCGLRIDGQIDCWGHRSSDQQPDYPQPLASAAVSAHEACGLLASGELVCWRPETGESLDISRWGVSAEDPPVRVFSGGAGPCALSAAGEVSCWWTGRPNDDSDRPWEEPPKGPFADIDVGARYACAIRVDGTVACWGEDSDLEIDEEIYDPMSDVDEGPGLPTVWWWLAAAAVVFAVAVIAPEAWRARRRRIVGQYPGKV